MKHLPIGFPGIGFAVLGAFCGATLPPSPAQADNPVVQTNYTADPAPMAYNGKVYLYTTHDEDVTVNNFFTMNDWRVYSSADMVNWTDHGSPLKYTDFTWAKGDAWAGQAVPRNGKFYFYVPMTQKSGGGAIGVAVSDSPTGPFKDALGKPLATTGTGDIDPTVFIDTDGQAYLYWGNPKLWYVKLNEDMISYPGKPTEVALTTAGFGTRSKTDRATAYEEGPWFYKRGSLYYIVYPGDGVPEDIRYTTSSSPTGPWTFRGVIMDKGLSGSAFTNHPGMLDFAGGSYFFYHSQTLPGGGGYKRSVCIEKFTYNADGTIPTIKMTTAGVPAVADLDPYTRTEAETIAFSAGLKTEVCSDGGINVTAISNGDYIKVKSVDFSAGVTSFEARVAAAAAGGSIEIRLDSLTGTLAGTCAIAATGGAQTWATQTCAVSGITGKKDVFFKFTGGSGELFKFNWWKFIPKDALPDAGATDVAPRDAGLDTTTATGGMSAVDGSVGTGGVPRTGGVASSGGVSSSGGSVGSGGVSMGGVPNTGGVIAGSGGIRATGGAVATGGSTLSTGGNATPTNTGGASTQNRTGGSTGPIATTSDGGCSCQTTPGRHSAFLSLLIPAVVLGWRRRSKRTR